MDKDLYVEIFYHPVIKQERVIARRLSSLLLQEKVKFTCSPVFKNYADGVSINGKILYAGSFDGVSIPDVERNVLEGINKLRQKESQLAG